MTIQSWQKCISSNFKVVIIKKNQIKVCKNFQHDKRFDRIFGANYLPYGFAIREGFFWMGIFFQCFAESLGIYKNLAKIVPIPKNYILTFMHHSFSKFKKNPFYKRERLHASRRRNSYFGKPHFRKNSPLKIIWTHCPKI